MTPAHCRRLFFSRGVMTEFQWFMVMFIPVATGLLGYILGVKKGLSLVKVAIFNELDKITQSLTQDLKKIVRLFTETDGKTIRVFRSDSKLFVTQGQSLDEVFKNLVDQQILSFQVMHQGEVMLWLDGVDITKHADKNKL